MNSREGPFTRVVCSVPPSKWPLHPSCLLILSIPFFLAFQFWFLSLTSTLGADRQSQNWCLICRSKFRFCWVQLRFDGHCGMVLTGEGNSDTSAFWREETYIRQNPKSACIRILCLSFSFSKRVS
jgi:hypothetical protein